MRVVRTINVSILTDKIIAEPTHIQTILEKLGHEDIRDKGKYYCCKNLDGDNPTAISILKSTLQYSNYTRGSNGNIYTLVMDERHINFPQALDLIGHWLGIKDQVGYKIKYPFHSFYKNILAEQDAPETCLQSHTEAELPPIGYNMQFLNDGIDLITQEKYNLRFDVDKNCICVPIYTIEGNLVGCKARNNDKNCDDGSRWWAYIPFPKSCVVYGLNFNYTSIAKKGMCFVGESEKFAQQLTSMGINLGVGIFGHDISSTQSKILKSLFLNEIIVCFDEGICEEEIIYQSKKLKTNLMHIDTKVSYIFDKENKYLPKGSKAAPSDLGKDIFLKLYKECKFTLEG